MTEPLQPIEPSKSTGTAAAGQALERVQQKPAQSLASAFVLGLVLSVFPVGRIVAFVVSLGLALLRPLLLVLGGVKLWEEVKRREK